MKTQNANARVHGDADAHDLAQDAFAKHRGELHRYVIQMSKNPQEAADLVQEVFARLLRVKRAELVRSPTDYIYGIARHVVSEFKMRAHKQRVIYDSSVVEAFSDSICASQPDDAAEDLDISERITKAVAKLAPTKQAIFLLAKRDGKSNAQVAKRLKLSPNTVKTYLKRAMSELGKNLKK